MSKFHIPRKRFGQHFLHDPAIIQHIIDSFAPKLGDTIAEIGPGQGALTTRILPITKHLDVVELDRDLIPILKNNCYGLGELTVHQSDALQFDFSSLTKSTHNLRIIGNLPYNISTPLLFHLFEYTASIKDMVFMLQKEVADRLVAPAGTKNYGRLSVMAQYYAQIEKWFSVKPGAFNPPPKVDSAIVQLIPHRELPYPAIRFSRFDEIVKQAFSQRRKTLRKSLQGLVTAEQLAAADIDPQQRPEQLNVEMFVRLSNISLS